MANDILLPGSGSGLKDFLSALVKPLQTQTDGMKTFETEYLKRARFNGRKIVLQAALNDIFGVSGIIVEWNRSVAELEYSYNEVENGPTYSYNMAENQPTYSFNDGETPSENYDFKVLIPSGIYTTELDRRISAEVNLYKVMGTRFLTEQY
jgi:hypothetical protein